MFVRHNLSAYRRKRALRAIRALADLTTDPDRGARAWIL
jgi:hypothetical protein